MADAMRGATKAMGVMNKQMNLPALTKIMRDFERQNEKMEMTSEMMGDAVDDAFEVLAPAPALGLGSYCVFQASMLFDLSEERERACVPWQESDHHLSSLP